MELKEVLRQRFDAAFAAAGLEGPSVVQVANRPEFGDYQANGVMGASCTGALAGMGARAATRSTTKLCSSRPRVNTTMSIQ